MHARTVKLLVPAIVITAFLLVSLQGCDVGRDPNKTVTVEVIGIPTESDRKLVLETLKSMTDGSSRYITSTASGDTMTVTIWPVSDVTAFSQRINFGKVTNVRGRVVKIDFLLPSNKA